MSAVCPTCGARNPDSADWCLQCFAPNPGSADAGRPDTLPSVADPPERDPLTVDAPRVTVDGVDTTRIRTDGGDVEWRCRVCDTWNPLDRAACGVCGATFESRRPDVGPPPVNPGAALAASAVLPGAGHWLVGRRAAAVSRALLYVAWVVGGVVLWREAAAAGQPVVPAVPPLVGALALWAGTLADTSSALRGQAPDRDLLGPRTLLWVVVGVVGGVLVAFVLTTMRI